LGKELGFFIDGNISQNEIKIFIYPLICMKTGGLNITV
jgi:hypothetical protein